MATESESWRSRVPPGHSTAPPAAAPPASAALFWDVLLPLARLPLAAAADAVRSLLGPAVNWELLLELAEAHGLVPWLAWHARDLAGELPPTAYSALQDRQLDHRRRALLLTHTLLQVLQLLGDEVAAIPFKGPALAQLLHGDFTLRQSWDLDLIVPRHQVRRAAEILAAAGFRAVYPLAPAQMDALLHSNCEVSLLSPAGILLEVQWGVAPRHFSLPFSTDDCFPRARALRLGTADVRAFAPEDLLFLLSVHGAKHQWSRLAWIADVHHLLGRHPDLDWDLLFQRAQQARAQRILRLALCLSASLFGTTLPPEIAQACRRDAGCTSLARQVERRLSLPRDGGEMAAHLFFLRAREKWADRFRYVVLFLLTPGIHEWSLVRLPRPLHWLYYPFRMALGATKAAQLAARTLFSARRKRN